MKRIAVSILLTPHPDSSRVYLVERNSELSFFGGYLAFPGGTLEEDDGKVEVRNVPQLEAPLNADYSLFVAAAARELFEETGLWMARGGPPLSRSRLDTLRRRLIEGEIRFPNLLQEHHLFIDASDFTPICRITTPPFTRVRYDTWFLQCRLPEGAHPEIWPGELESGSFQTAEDALAGWKKGQAVIVPPVLILLQKLAGRSVHTFLPQVRRLTDSYERGKLHRVHFTCGVLTAPLNTRTRPPATHTNVYVVGEDRLYLIDPGSSFPEEQEKLWELLDELRSEGRRLEGILLTHHHPDHAGAVSACRKRYRIPLFAHPETADRLSGVECSGYLNDGDQLELGTAPDGSTGWKLEVLHLPGHAPGHLAFRESRYGAVMAGDLVSTLSPVLIDPCEGTLIQYLDSLERLQEITHGTLYPGHGPPALNGRQAVSRAIQHRKMREQKILRALQPTPRTLERIFENAYDDVLDPALRQLATRSLQSGLQKLVAEGKAEQSTHGFRLRQESSKESSKG